MILATALRLWKTTTLYTLIKMLNSPEVSIITIEDPIEYSIDEIEQIQVNARHGLTFANGLMEYLEARSEYCDGGRIRYRDSEHCSEHCFDWTPPSLDAPYQ